MKYVRVVEGRVTEIIPDYALPIEKWYGTEFAKLCIMVDDGVCLGDYIDVGLEKSD